MPTYEYRCISCNKRVSIFQSYEAYGQEAVSCPNCGSEDLKRLISKVRVVRSEESRLESMADPSVWDGIDEDDPRTMARMMRQMGEEMGEEMPPEFDEVVDRLEAGESPEEIEKSMPDLGGGDDMDFMG
ncbi:MAG: zinc ribbon domain-containing protein [Anaerolineales bacterium]|nr:zinc ribbon domain-containing protein [Anaerolineales bacterium]